MAIIMSHLNNYDIRIFLMWEIIIAMKKYFFYILNIIIKLLSSEMIKLRIHNRISENKFCVAIIWFLTDQEDFEVTNYCCTSSM